MLTDWLYTKLEDKHVKILFKHSSKGILSEEGQMEPSIINPSEIELTEQDIRNGSHRWPVLLHIEFGNSTKASGFLFQNASLYPKPEEHNDFEKTTASVVLLWGRKWQMLLWTTAVWANRQRNGNQSLSIAHRSFFNEWQYYIWNDNIRRSKRLKLQIFCKTAATANNKRLY